MKSFIKFLIIFSISPCYSMITDEQAQKIKKICENKNFSGEQKLQELNKNNLMIEPDKLDVRTKRLLIPVYNGALAENNELINYYKGRNRSINWSLILHGIPKILAPLGALTLLRLHLDFNCEHFDTFSCHPAFILSSGMTIGFGALYVANDGIEKITLGINYLTKVEKHSKVLATYKNFLEQ